VRSDDEEAAQLRKSQGRSRWLVVLLMLLGLFAGNVVGQALETLVPAMAIGAKASFGPTELSILGLLKITAGLSLYVNLMGALGGILAAVAASRL